MVKTKIKKVFETHKPFWDADRDVFASNSFGLRGSAWRGQDCSDRNSNQYPGRKVSNDQASDYNCNGIHGVNPQTRKPYKEELCSGVQQRGIVIG
jgi:acyloxyacyl hydrolase